MDAIGWRRTPAIAAAALIVLVSLAGSRAAAAEPPAGSPPAASPDPPTPASPLTLVVGQVGEMSVRNPLSPAANNVPTNAVLYRVFDTVLLSDPVVDRPMAYIVKGVDYDEDGVFETATEYDVFAERAGATTPLEITLYYDFNGVRWHDGTQMTPWDLFFSYHLNAMNVRFSTDLRVLFCGPGMSYEGCNRQLGVELAPKSWQGEGAMPGDPNLRVAVRHTLNEPFALFYGSTIAPVMFPMHLWSRTGGGRHVDFGCAVWLPPLEAASRGIPECGNADPARWGDGIASSETVTGSKPYDYVDVEGWGMQDADVIGHGPFRFVSWTSGVETVVTRNEDFFTGIDALTSTVFDPILSSTLKKPTTDGIQYVPYANADLCAAALNISAVDFCHVNLPPATVPPLLANPDVAVESNAEPGFMYMGYNMRKAPFGYLLNDSANDVGYWFRQAVSHLANKTYLVDVLLQGFGVIGHGFVSPANTFWYNDAIPKPDYNYTAAISILDSPEALAAGIGADPPGVCGETTPDGCRLLPGTGNATFEILAPEMSYDVVRATAADMIAQSMRDAGLNAKATHLPFSNITTRMYETNFDMYILGWRIGGTDPDYLFAFFHSSNEAPWGQNFPSFRNATFDAVIDASRAEIDLPTRQALIFQAQAILSDARPYEVLYYRTNIEAYRQDRWVNWSVVSGTIWNYWSLIGIHPPAGPGVVSITVDTSPPGLQVTVDANPFAAPITFPCTVGSVRTIGVPSPQTAGGTRHTFLSWSDGGNQTHDITCNVDETFVASFATEYEVTVATLPSGLQILVDGVARTSPYTSWCAASSVHSLDAPSPQTVGPSEYVFVSWSDGGAQAHDFTCEAPATVGARFQGTHSVTIDTVPSGLLVQVSATDYTTPFTFPCPEGLSHFVDALSPQNVAGVRYVFSNWSDGAPQSWILTCDASATYVANYLVEAFEVTVDTSPSGLAVEVDGVAYTAPHAFWCASGSTAALRAPTPQDVGGTQWAFSSWSDGGLVSHGVACDAPDTYVANYAVGAYQVTVDTTPPTLRVEIDGTPETAPHSFWCSAGGTATVGAPSPQETGGVRHVFSTWSDGGDASHSVSCDAAATYTATFLREFQITVDTSPSGLAVEVDGVTQTAPHIIWCPAGDTATVTVPSPQGSGGARDVFSSWSDGGAQTHDVACTAAGTFTATLSREYEITIATSPTGLVVTVDGADLTAPRTLWCTAGASVSVDVPTPQTLGAARYRFASWSDGGAITHEVPCDAAANVTATFEVEPAQPAGPPYAILAAILGIVVAVSVVVFLLWRRRRRGKQEPSEPQET